MSDSSVNPHSSYSLPIALHLSFFLPILHSSFISLPSCSLLPFLPSLHLQYHLTLIFLILPSFKSLFLTVPFPSLYCNPVYLLFSFPLVFIYLSIPPLPPFFWSFLAICLSTFPLFFFDFLNPSFPPLILYP